MKVLIISAIFWVECLASSQKPPTACMDPTFACQDLQTAKLCGTVKDCIHDIWSTLKAPNDNNDICDLCKQMVQEARDQLLSNETQEEIKEVFEGSCALIPIKLIADECKKLVDEFIPELIEMLASRMDPTMVCTVAGLCNGDLSKELSIAEVVSLIYQSKNHLCDDCKSIFNGVKQIFEKISQNEMESILLKICNEVPDSDKCEVLIKNNIATVYAFILNMDASDVCSMIGECPSLKKFNKYQDNMTCEFCEAMVQHLRDIILTNTTKEEFKTALLNLCSLFKSFASECKELVNDYYDTFYDLLDQVLNPQTLCTYLGLCSSSKTLTAKITISPLIKMWNDKHPERKEPLTNLDSTTSQPNFIPAIKIIPKHITHENKYNTLKSNIKSVINQLPIERMEHPILTFKQDEDCAFCKATMFFLSKDIINRNEKVIMDALDNVCKSWIPGYPKECENFIDEYYKKIVELLLFGVEYEEVCDFLKACRSEKMKAVKVMPPLESRNNLVCDICEKVMVYLENKLKDKATEEEIREALDDVCTVLPSSMTKQCKNFVDTYTDTIVSLIIQEIKPADICNALGLCNKNSKAPIKSQFTCELCQDVMTYLDQVLKDPKTEDEIKKALDEVCTILPQSMTQQCTDFVNQYTDLIIDLLLQEFNPDQICAALGLCPKNSKAPIKSQFTCELCQAVMTYLKQVLKDPKTEDEIKKALDEVCTILPQSMTQQCTDFVNQYSNLIISLLLQEFDPDKVCAALGLCSKENILNVENENLECILCKQIMTVLENELKNKKTESEIKATLDMVCSLLPQSFDGKCRYFIDKYADTIITLLVQDVKPNMICAVLNICPSQNFECTLCQYFLHFLQEQLMENSTESEIKNLVEKVCSYLPKSISTQCDAFVREYGDAVIVLLAQQIDPSIVCPLFKICLPVETKKIIRLNTCQVCETAVTYIDELLENDSVDKEITDLATRVCSLLPQSSKQECVSIIELYGPHILQMIGSLANNTQVCQSIDLCPRVTGHVHILGSEKCTFGPDYWCKSSAHAAACKAEEFCKKKVWKN